MTPNTIETRETIARELIEKLLFIRENVDETGYVEDVGFYPVESVLEEARRFLEAADKIATASASTLGGGDARELIDIVELEIAHLERLHNPNPFDRIRKLQLKKAVAKVKAATPSPAGDEVSWFIVDAYENNHKLRGPFADEATAGAVRSEMERGTRYDGCNLCIVYEKSKAQAPAPQSADEMERIANEHATLLMSSMGDAQSLWHTIRDNILSALRHHGGKGAV